MTDANEWNAKGKKKERKLRSMHNGTLKFNQIKQRPKKFKSRLY